VNDPGASGSSIINTIDSVPSGGVLQISSGEIFWLSQVNFNGISSLSPKLGLRIRNSSDSIIILVVVTVAVVVKVVETVDVIVSVKVVVLLMVVVTVAVIIDVEIAVFVVVIDFVIDVVVVIVAVVSSAGVTNVPLNDDNPIPMIMPIINPIPSCILLIFMIDVIVIYRKLINK
tara:strand:- start:83 stop:604 length:522 start_codon:yes stop_codon:yes gene_type:complete